MEKQRRRNDTNKEYDNYVNVIMYNYNNLNDVDDYMFFFEKAPLFFTTLYHTYKSNINLLNNLYQIFTQIDVNAGYRDFFLNSFFANFCNSSEETFSNDITYFSEKIIAECSILNKYFDCFNFFSEYLGNGEYTDETETSIVYFDTNFKHHFSTPISQGRFDTELEKLYKKTLIEFTLKKEDE